MAVKAKMYVTGIEPVNAEHPEWGSKIRFLCEYDPELPEDQRFCTATPSGTAEYLITNPKALDQFVLGKAYYVTFEAV